VPHDLALERLPDPPLTRRPHPGPASSPDADRHPDGRGPHGQPAELLALQRRAGNRAVATTLRGTATVQRFEGDEHKALGDSTGRMIDLGNGVVVSWGDIVALAGDEYGSFDELLADTRDEVGKQRLLAAFMNDHIPSPAMLGVAPPTQEQQNARFLAFLALTAENPEHFNGGGQAVDRWRTEHAAAVAASVDAGLLNDPAGRQLAQGREAFGQHFLTDAFSGGHVRTPRPEIIAWYRKNFGPPVVDHVVAQLSARLVEGLVAQISPQTMAPDALIRPKVRAAVDQRLAAAITTIGGRAKLDDYFALGVAGIVSGAMHDLEGERGVVVSSTAHPEPWMAYGDARLDKSPESRLQAELAIDAAAAHLDTAFAIGRKHATTASAAAVTYFGFDSAALTPAGAREVAAVAKHLHEHPEILVTVTGHTDPTGTDAYNEELGLRRAQAVATALAAAGLPADQVVVASEGRRSLASTAPAQYRLNRRATFTYSARPGPFQNPFHDPVREAAVTEANATIAPPYADVDRFVPQPLPAASVPGALGPSTLAGSQLPLETYLWGAIPATLREGINGWVRGYAPMLTGRLATEPALDDTTVEGFAIQPRPLVQAIVTDLLADPSAFLEGALGRPMGP
jgi:outer membrane protein OmpA-like peptidoglycan-associated protein